MPPVRRQANAVHHVDHHDFVWASICLRGWQNPYNWVVQSGDHVRTTSLTLTYFLSLPQNAG